MWTSVVAMVSQTVLVLDVRTVHHPWVTSTLGPVHGPAHLATIEVVLLRPRSTGPRWRTLVPGFGGLLVLRRVRQEPPTAGGPRR